MSRLASGPVLEWPRASLEACTDALLRRQVADERPTVVDILPLVKQHGAAVIGLTTDEGGIPKTPEERLTIAGKILTQAVKPVDRLGCAV